MGRVFIGQPANLEFKESKIRAGGQEKPTWMLLSASTFLFVLKVRCFIGVQVVLLTAIGVWKIFWHVGN